MREHRKRARATDRKTRQRYRGSQRKRREIDRRTNMETDSE